MSLAVSSLEERARFFEELFGMRVQEDSYGDSSEGYRAISLSIPGSDTQLELISPAGNDSFIDRFLTQKGSMVHHLTFEVTDIREAARVLREYGIEPFGYREDAEWARELFIHPRDTGGVLIQLFEPHQEAPSAT